MCRRSHECKEQGYEVEHGGKTITIFSAPNYCDQMGNKGAYIHLDKTLIPKFTSFSAVPHPPVPPPLSLFLFLLSLCPHCFSWVALQARALKAPPRFVMLVLVLAFLTLAPLVYACVRVPPCPLSACARRYVASRCEPCTTLALEAASTS